MKEIPVLLPILTHTGQLTQTETGSLIELIRENSNRPSYYLIIFLCLLTLRYINHVEKKGEARLEQAGEPEASRDDEYHDD